MELLRSLSRGNLLFKDITINYFITIKLMEKVKDKEHLKLRCLVQEGPGSSQVPLWDYHERDKSVWCCTSQRRV